MTTHPTPDIDISRQAVADREVGLDHHIVGWDTTSGVQPEDRPARDPLRTIIRRIFANPPTNLTDEEKQALRAALDTGDRSDQRVLIDVPASEATVDTIVLQGEEAELTETFMQSGAPQSARYADLINSSLIGYLTEDPDPAAYTVGQWYFNTIQHRPRVVTDLDVLTPGVQKGFVDAVLTELIPGNEAYTGEFEDDEAAGAQVAAVRDVYFNTTLEILRVCQAITPGTATHTGWRFKRVATSLTGGK